MTERLTKEQQEAIEMERAIEREKYRKQSWEKRRWSRIPDYGPSADDSPLANGGWGRYNWRR